MSCGSSWITSWTSPGVTCLSRIWNTARAASSGSIGALCEVLGYPGQEVFSRANLLRLSSRVPSLVIDIQHWELVAEQPEAALPTTRVEPIEALADKSSRRVMAGCGTVCFSRNVLHESGVSRIFRPSAEGLH